ncbi:hypothetical protein ADUPG1_007679 [Aduncisulcus paluster]|uniref:Uncharacterized protein n=1 Tax=Aduncisulcus paluster TaxID=2918883 RepID=A0ABQ5KP73_9EUKA|nr:hypothetical protein ADUPG1_007679 [Aduncisulcus paluster]
MGIKTPPFRVIDDFEPYPQRDFNLPWPPKPRRHPVFSTEPLYCSGFFSMRKTLITVVDLEVLMDSHKFDSSESPEKVATQHCHPLWMKQELLDEKDDVRYSYSEGKTARLHALQEILAADERDAKKMDSSRGVRVSDGNGFKSSQHIVVARLAYHILSVTPEIPDVVVSTSAKTSFPYLTQRCGHLVPHISVMRSWLKNEGISTVEDLPKSCLGISHSVRRRKRLFRNCSKKELVIELSLRLLERLLTYTRVGRGVYPLTIDKTHSFRYITMPFTQHHSGMYHSRSVSPPPIKKKKPLKRIKKLGRSPLKRPSRSSGAAPFSMMSSSGDGTFVSFPSSSSRGISSTLFVPGSVLRSLMSAPAEPPAIHGSELEKIMNNPNPLRRRRFSRSLPNSPWVCGCASDMYHPAMIALRLGIEENTIEREWHSLSEKKLYPSESVAKNDYFSTSAQRSVKRRSFLPSDPLPHSTACVDIYNPMINGGGGRKKPLLIGAPSSSSPSHGSIHELPAIPSCHLHVCVDVDFSYVDAALLKDREREDERESESSSFSLLYSENASLASAISSPPLSLTSSIAMCPSSPLSEEREHEEEGDGEGDRRQRSTPLSRKTSLLRHSTLPASNSLSLISSLSSATSSLPSNLGINSTIPREEEEEEREDGSENGFTGPSQIQCQCIAISGGFSYEKESVLWAQKILNSTSRRRRNGRTEIGARRTRISCKIGKPTRISPRCESSASIL